MQRWPWRIARASFYRFLPQALSAKHGAVLTFNADEHVAFRSGRNLLDGATKRRPCILGFAIRAHHDEVRFLALGEVEDCLTRLPPVNGLRADRHAVLLC